MPTQSSSTVSHVRSFYDRLLLVRLLPHLVHTMFAQVRDVPQKMTNVIKFRRYNALSLATTPLTAGVTPATASLTVTDISATLAHYGNPIETSDELLDTTEDNYLNEITKLLAENAGQSLDQVCRDVIVAGTSVQYASSASSRATVTSSMKLNVSEIREAVRTLKTNNARKITSMISPSNGVDTIPVNACYVAIVHPNTTRDLKDDANFVPVEHYPNQSDVMPGEVGKMDEVRFIETTYAKVFTGAGSGAIDVYATLILGADAYGVSRLSGKALEMISKPLGSAGTADPLNQRATDSWKAWFVAKILQDLAMVRVEHAVSS